MVAQAQATTAAAAPPPAESVSEKNNQEQLQEQEQEKEKNLFYTAKEASGQELSDSNGGSATPTSMQSQAEGTNTKKYPTGAPFWLSFLSLCIVIILGGLDFSIIGVAVPAITQEFYSISDVAWYNISYRLTACATQFAWGQIYSQYSIRRCYIAGTVVFMVGSVVSATAKSSVVFIVGRSITGVGSAGVLTGLFTAVADICPLKTRALYLSLLSGLEATAMIVAPILGGALTQHLTWRWCFYINLPLGAVSMVGLALLISDAKPPGYKEDLSWKQLLHRMDLVGTGSLIAALTCLFMVLSWAGFKYAWSDWRVIVLLVFFCLTLIVFCYDQVRMGEDAALPPRLLKQRSLLGACLFTWLLNGSVFVVQYYLPIYFQVVRGYKPAASGYMMLPVLVGFNIALIAQGFVTSAIGYYVPFMILASVLLSVGCGLITTWTLSTSVALLLVYQAIFGLGGGLAFEIPQIAAQTVLSEADATIGTAMTLFAQNFGGALFIGVAQQVFGQRLMRNLAGKVPGLTAQDIQNLGLVDISGLDAGSDGVLAGLEDAFLQTWYIAVALAALTIIACAMMEWRSVREEKPKPEEVLETA